MNPALSSLNTDFPLILRLSRYYPSRQNFPSDIVDSLVAHCDFDLFQKKLARARTWPMVYHNITTYQVKFPEAVHQILKKKAQRTAFRNLKNHRMLKQLQHAFWEKRIPCFSLKGTLLSKRLTGSIGLRHSIDIDLLVQPERITESRQLLENMGYECLDEKYYGKLDHQQLKKFMHHSVFRHKQTRCLLELHWRLSRFRNDICLSRQFWDHLKFTAEMSCRLLPDDELLLYLCWHGSKHLWFRLKWLVDIFQLINQKQWDWRHLWIKANRYRCERSFALGIVLSHEIYQTPLPQEIRKYLKNQPLICRLAQKAINLLNPDKVTDISPENYGIEIRKIWNQIRLSSSYSCKIEIAAASIRPRRLDMQVIHLPKCLFFAYYMLRPVRIASSVFKRFYKNA